MRHRYQQTKLGRNTKQRQALFKQLAAALILHEQIKTTEAKAKVLVRLMDKLITQAKKGSLSARRQLLAFFNLKQAVHKLFDVIAPRTKDRTSGFTRLIRLGRRKGDNAMLMRVEFIDKSAAKPESEKK